MKCGKSYCVIPAREFKTKYCSRSCLGRSHVPWSKGLTSRTSEKIREMTNKATLTKKRLFALGLIKPHNKGIPMSESQRKLISDRLKGNSHSSKNGFKKGHVPWFVKRGVLNPTKRPEIIERLKDFRGEKHSRWLGGISREPYNFDFSPELKLMIRQRDIFKCQECDMIEEEHQKKYHKNLTIHHINYNKKDCNEANLITLCLQCNSLANANRTGWQIYYQERMHGII